MTFNIFDFKKSNWVKNRLYYTIMTFTIFDFKKSNWVKNRLLSYDNDF